MAVPTLSREQCRDLDRRAVGEYGISSAVLMENAGRGVADWLADWNIEHAWEPIVICCGRGNNGGDGFVVARHLDLRRVPVRVLLWCDPRELKGDAATNYHIIQRSGVPIEVFGARHDSRRLEAQLADAAWIVDALLGTGAEGEPRPPLDEVIRQLNADPAPKLAIDLPSGLDCDTGEAARSTIIAAYTCTFVAYKLGFLAPGADQYTGDVHVLDIGAPRKLVDEMLRGNSGPRCT